MTDKTKNPPEIMSGARPLSATHVEELGAVAAETICANLKAANDDAPNFGPVSHTPYGRMLDGNYDPSILAEALAQLRALSLPITPKSALPTAMFKGKFAQNFRVILGNQDEQR